MPQYGWPINWNASTGDPVLLHPLYIKYSSTSIQNLNKADVQADLGNALADRQSASVINYLVWLIRTYDLYVSP